MKYRGRFSGLGNVLVLIFGHVHRRSSCASSLISVIYLIYLLGVCIKYNNENKTESHLHAFLRNKKSPKKDKERQQNKGLDKDKENRSTQTQQDVGVPTLPSK